MTKAQLIDSVADSVEGLTRRQATAAFEAVFAAITEAVKAGESAKVPGFGSFTLSERAVRKGRNPATGEALTLKASRSVRFKPGKELREELRKRRHETVRSKRRKHVAEAASADEISRSVGVTPREAQQVDRILEGLGYLKRR